MIKTVGSSHESGSGSGSHEGPPGPPSGPPPTVNVYSSFGFIALVQSWIVSDLQITVEPPYNVTSIQRKARPTPANLILYNVSYSRSRELLYREVRLYIHLI